MLSILLISLALVCNQWQLLARPQQAPPDELLQYVRDAKKAGLNADQIEKNAIQAGWAQPIVTQVLDLVLKPEKTTSKTPTSSAGEDVLATPEVKDEVKPEVKQEAKPEVKQPEAKTPAESPAVTPAVHPPAETPAVVVSAVDRTIRDEYRIGEGDVLQISVWGEPATSAPSGVVRPDGMISLPLIKDIGVSGFTPAEAEKAITELLSKQIKGADVTVIVSQIHSKKIFVVGGGVKKEGDFFYLPDDDHAGPE